MGKLAIHRPIKTLWGGMWFNVHVMTARSTILKLGAWYLLPGSVVGRGIALFNECQERRVL
jgi:hypothetical protein